MIPARTGGDWNAGNWSYPFFTTYQWQWTDGVGTPFGSVDGRHKDLDWDCDWTNTNGGSPIEGCSTMPRYRHSKTVNVAFCDGHVKAMPRGRINWFRNIYPGNLGGYWLNYYEPYP